jgi:hypothetical protein
MLVPGFFCVLETHLTPRFADRGRSHVDLSIRFFLSHPLSACIS